MRVYLPATLSTMAALFRDGQIGPAPVRGYAVTAALREWYSSGDLEELEYAAMTQAAKDSLRLLRADPEAPPRRVVIAADVADKFVAEVGGFDEPSLVKIGYRRPGQRGGFRSYRRSRCRGGHPGGGRGAARR